eukprot:tig00000455_g989.t1
MPDLRFFIQGNWSSGIALQQTPASGEILYPSFSSPSNPLWGAALPASSAGVYQAAITVLNPTGTGPVGSCSFPINVVDSRGPCLSGACPPPLRLLPATPEQFCTTPFPDLRAEMNLAGAQGTCLRPHSITPESFAQSPDPTGRTIYLGTAIDVALSSPVFPQGSRCPVKVAMYRPSAPRIATLTPATSDPRGFAAVGVGPGSSFAATALTEFDLMFTMSDKTCGDSALRHSCNLRLTSNDPAILPNGTLAFPGANGAQAWSMGVMFSMDDYDPLLALGGFNVKLSPAVPQSVYDGAANGTVLRTYRALAACAFNKGLDPNVPVYRSFFSWRIDLVKNPPEPSTPLPTDLGALARKRSRKLASLEEEELEAAGL